MFCCSYRFPLDNDSSSPFGVGSVSSTSGSQSVQCSDHSQPSYDMTTPKMDGDEKSTRLMLTNSCLVYVYVCIVLIEHMTIVKA